MVVTELLWEMLVIMVYLLLKCLFQILIRYKTKTRIVFKNQIVSLHSRWKLMLQAVVVHWGWSREVYLTLLYLLPISQLYFLYLCFLVFLIFSLETEVAGSGGALGCSGEVYLTWTHFKVESDELSRHHHHHHRHSHHHHHHHQYGVFALDSLQS